MKNAQKRKLNLNKVYSEIYSQINIYTIPTSVEAVGM